MNGLAPWMEQERLLEPPCLDGDLHIIEEHHTRRVFGVLKLEYAEVLGKLRI